jgi:O-antigen/teichoic acid export membrane protein
VVSLSTSFLGGAVLQDKAPHGWLSWAAIGSFLGAVAITLVLLLPRRRWVFGLSAKDIFEGYAVGTHPRGLATTHRFLAVYLERREDQNIGRLDVLYWLFTAACVLLGAEILLWLLALIWR